MKECGKEFFDQCLKAIVGELETVENQHPDWSGDVVCAASSISEKATKLVEAAIDHKAGKSRFREEVLVEAAQTGAMVLKFLVVASRGFQRRPAAEIADHG